MNCTKVEVAEDEIPFSREYEILSQAAPATPLAHFALWGRAPEVEGYLEESIYLMDDRFKRWFVSVQVDAMIRTLKSLL
jgi:hypothetical protein